MTLPGGQISLSQVNVELGRSSSAQINMNNSALRGTFGVSSGQIAMSSGRNQSNIKAFSASPTSVNAGSSSTLSSTFYANSGSVSPTVGAVSSGTGYSVTPGSTTTYTLTAGGSTATASVTVIAASAVRPTSAAYTGTTPTNGTSAYDTTASSVDTSTYNTIFTTGNNTSTQTYSFAAGTKTGTLRVRFDTADTDYQESLSGMYIASSDITLAVSTDGGSNYTVIYQYAAGASGIGDIWTYALTNQNMANLKVKVTTHSMKTGPVSDLAVATVTCYISDIVVY